MFGLWLSSYVFDNAFTNLEMTDRSDRARLQAFKLLVEQGRNTLILQTITMNFLPHFGPIVFFASIGILTLCGAYIPIILVVLYSVPLDLGDFAMGCMLSVTTLLAAAWAPLLGAVVDEIGFVITLMIVANWQIVTIASLQYLLWYHMEDVEPSVLAN